MGYTNKSNKIKLIFNIFLVVFLIGSYFFFKQIQSEYLAINSFQKCVDAGYPVLSTYPEQCKIPGKVFTNDIQTKEADNKEATTTAPEKNLNPKNTSYDIEGDHVLLQNGEWYFVDPAASVKKIVKYFGNELRLDVNGDGKEDTVFLMTESTGGSGTFFYVVAALNKDGGYVGTNGVLLGDRIAPQTTEFKNGEIVVNYADRNPGEPMTTKPSLGISRYFKIDNDTLTEVQK